MKAITNADVGLIYPKEQYNPGCDVVWVLDLFNGGKNSIGIFFFELKYYFHANTYSNEAATKKVINALDGLIKSGVLETCKVSCVYFIMCTTIKQHRLEYIQEPKLQNLISTLLTKDITVNLHHVNTKEEWIHLLTPPLYYDLPDVSEDTDYSRIPQHMQK